MTKILIEVETQDFTCDEEKVNAICDKIIDVAEELNVNPIEFGAALGHLQGWVFDKYGVLAPATGVIKFLKEEVEL